MHKLLSTREKPIKVDHMTSNQSHYMDRVSLDQTNTDGVSLFVFPLLQQAGISPTIEQIEMFSNYLPGATLHEILVSQPTHFPAS